MHENGRLAEVATESVVGPLNGSFGMQNRDRVEHDGGTLAACETAIAGYDSTELAA